MAVSLNDSLNDAVSWLLPTHSLSDDSVLMDNENAPAAAEKNGVKSTGLKFKPSLVFPPEFPYEFDSLDSAFSSPVDSVIGSTETENTSDEEGDFLAGLTQRLTHSSTRKLEKSWVVAGSPESTLSGLWSVSVSSNGSPNCPSSLVSSPPTTPFGGQNDTRDLISAAAGQIARMKTCDRTETVPNYSNGHARGLLAPPKSTSPVNVIKTPSLGFYTGQSVNFDLAANTTQYHRYVEQQEQMLKVMRATWASSQPQQIQNKAIDFGYENARCGQQLPQSAWPPLLVQQQQQQRPVLVSGSGCVRRECAGTGVFLPRRYVNSNNNNNPHDSRRKSGSPNVLVPHVQQRFHSCFGPNHDAMIARRNALITLQKRSLRAAARNHNDIHLPKEWTY